MAETLAPARFAAPKPFCPCDVEQPQDCKPEEWPGAHSHRDCLNCGQPSYAHTRRLEQETSGGSFWVLACFAGQGKAEPK